MTGAGKWTAVDVLNGFHNGECGVVGLVCAAGGVPCGTLIHLSSVSKGMVLGSL